MDELLTVGISIDTSGVKDGLKEIGNTGARASAELEESLTEAAQGMKRLEQATQETTEKIKRLEQKTEDLGDKYGKTASRSGQLGGALGRIHPSLEEGSRLVADLADALEVASLGGASLLRIVGPIGAAIGVAAGAFMILKQNLDDANESMEKAAERAQEMVDLHTQVKEAALLQALAEERITQEEFNQIASAKTAADAFRLQREEREKSLHVIDQQIAQAMELVETHGATIARYREMIENDQDYRNATSATRAELEQAAHKLASLNQERMVAQTAVDIITTAEDKYAQTLTDTADAQLHASEISQQRAQQQRDEAEALKALGNIRREQALAQLTDLQKINFLLDERVDRLLELQEITGQDVTEDIIAAERIAIVETLELEKKLAEERKKAQEQRDAAHEKEMAAIKAETDARMEALGNVGAAYGDLANLAVQAANRRATIDEASARRSLQAAKSLGLVQIAIDTAVGIQKALAQAAGRPLRAAAGIAAVLTGSAVQTAAVASQSLHSGGDIAPDEQEIRTIILRDEAVTSRGEVLSPEETRQRDTGGSTVIIPAYQHFGQFFADVVESGGTPLHHLINEGRTLGRVGY